ncbi:hypothetical protein GCM10010236_24750 [Streptomyces eurythermus]|nr:hypothetical protein GCM10010236_24750 [Streptomyces eurythermus]
MAGPGIRRLVAAYGMTCGNAKTANLIGVAGPVEGTYPQFGPVDDLAYTRWRATW